MRHCWLPGDTYYTEESEPGSSRRCTRDPAVSFVIRQIAYLRMKAQVARNLNLDFEIARARTREMLLRYSQSIFMYTCSLDRRSVRLFTCLREENDE